MKAFTKIIAAAVAAIGVVSIAGCSNSNPIVKVNTSANWNARTSVAVESNFSDRWLNNKEVAEYSVSFSEGANATYSVSYAEGSVYKTEFYMENFDWSKIEGLPEGYAPAENTQELVYVFNTAWEISGEYTLKATGEKKQFEDVVSSSCYFRLAGNNLQPVYSYQAMKNTAPNSLNATSIGNMCVEIDSVYETFYNYDCSKATISHTNNLVNSSDKTAVREVSVTDKAGHSVFDNSQLRAAVRAFNLSGGATHTFNVLTPQNGGIQMCTATCTAPVVLDDDNAEQKQIIDALNACSVSNPDYIFFDKTVAEGEEERNYRFNGVSMGINADSPMTGTSATLWFSTVENSEVNYSKCVLLRMTTPLSFGLGTLNYTLKSLNMVKM